MKTASLPDDEAARVAALHDLGILDTLPEQGFDDLVNLAAHVCSVPMAAISLLDTHRQWFKARTGLPVRELPRESAFCAHAILSSDLMVVCDTQADTRFADNPLVLGDPKIRFYAGMPLITDEGFALGTLCVIDRKVRRLTGEQEQTLRLLARLVVSHLNNAGQVASLHRIVEEKKRLVHEKEQLILERELAEAERIRLASIVESSEEAILGLALDGEIVSWNRGSERLFGYAKSEIIGRSFAILEPESAQSVVPTIVERLRQCESAGVIELENVRGSASALDAAFSFSPIRDVSGHLTGVSCIVRDITARKAAEEALWESTYALARSESLFRTSVSAMSEGLVLQGVDGAILMCNESAERILGVSQDQMAGRTSLDPRWRSVRENGDPFPGEEHPAMVALRENRAQRDVILGVHKPDGQLAWVSVNAVPMSENTEAGCGDVLSPQSVVVTFADVTERRRQEVLLRESHRALQESQSRLLDAQRVAQVGSWELDLESNELSWSDALYNLMQMDPARGAPTVDAVLERYHPGDRAMRSKIIAKAMRDGRPYEFDIRVLRLDGTIRWMHAVGQGKCDGDGKVLRLFGTLMDIHDRKMTEERMRDHSRVLETRKDELETANAELARLAVTDGLTELKNHRAFQETLAEDVESSRRSGTALSLIMFDVDDFKPFNDTFGHPAGDEVLRTIGRLLSKATHSRDISARYGGEEFALILQQTELAEAAAIAERLRRAIRDHHWPVRPVTASFGVAALRDSAETASELIGRADAALYRSKQAGRNRVTCDEICN